MIYCNSLKLSFIWMFHDKKSADCVEFSLAFFGTLTYGYVIKASEMYNFLLLINSSVTIGFSFLLLLISTITSSKTINTLHFFPRLHSSIIL